MKGGFYIAICSTISELKRIRKVNLVYAIGIWKPITRTNFSSKNLPLSSLFLNYLSKASLQNLPLTRIYHHQRQRKVFFLFSFLTCTELSFQSLFNANYSRLLSSSMSPLSSHSVFMRTRATKREFLHFWI